VHIVTAGLAPEERKHPKPRHVAAAIQTAITGTLMAFVLVIHHMSATGGFVVWVYQLAETKTCNRL
jgi:hypothetical protein